MKGFVQLGALISRGQVGAVGSGAAILNPDPSRFRITHIGRIQV